MIVFFLRGCDYAFEFFELNLDSRTILKFFSRYNKLAKSEMIK